MKKIVHKNQVIITTLALLLAVVGYVSYDYKQNGGFEKSNKSVQTANESEGVNNEIPDTEIIDNPGETVLTSTVEKTADFAAEVKLNREQVR